jgi:hypothetical protein
MTELKGAVLEEQNGHQNYALHKIIAFNANDIARQRYELSKQLQDLHVDVALFSETHL